MPLSTVEATATDIRCCREGSVRLVEEQFEVCHLEREVGWLARRDEPEAEFEVPVGEALVGGDDAQPQAGHTREGGSVRGRADQGGSDAVMTCLRNDGEPCELPTAGVDLVAMMREVCGDVRAK